ncbi:MAG: hypothetical protein ABL882_01460 [Sphingopyxis sp.]
MDSKLKAIFGITEQQSHMRQQDIVIGDAPSGRALRARYVENETWLTMAGLTTSDLRDMVMTFTLVFVGAVIFLID